MTEPEQLAGYDDAGKNLAAQPRALDTPPSVPAASSPELRTLVAIAMGAIVVATLYIAQDVLIPITLAVMLSFVLSPLVDLLGRIGLWRAAAVAVSVLMALGAIALVGTLLGSQAATLAADVPHYAEAVQGKVGRIQSLATTRLAAITRIIGPGKPATAPVVLPAGRRGGRLDATLPAGGTPAQPLVVELATPTSSVLTVARAVIEPVLGPLETTIIVFIVAIFILMQREDLRDRFIRLVGSRDLHRTTLAMDDVGQRLSRYFVSQLGVNACFGTVIGLGLWLIGVPSAALWGVLAGLLRFVPYVGPLLAAVAPLTLAVAIDPGWWMAIYVGLLFLIIEPLTGYVVEPLLYGHSTGLSPVSVIVAAVFWTWIWGPVGLILSTPLTLCLVVIGRHVRSLEFFDVLLGDRPALSEVNRFYQRTLADDPDEALAQAETMLADRPLVDYYDSVVLPGLRLAAADEARGTISRQRASEMTRSILAVINDLAEHVDGKHADTPNQARMEESAAARIVSVAGRGPFDDVVSAMLVQLLAQRGVQARRVSYAGVSRETIAQLDLSAVQVIAVSHLEVGGAPAHLRYLIRRLRQRAPHSTLIAGLWAQGDPVLNDPHAQKALGGDRYVGSLREAIDASLASLSDPSPT
ncbi:MAG TPA: AI-2E family transporter [Vicinamibacterales bacterium]|nr:AI-2E family transporter [Vicinamibacterales bacterium]